MSTTHLSNHHLSIHGRPRWRGAAVVVPAADHSIWQIVQQARLAREDAADLDATSLALQAGAAMKRAKKVAGNRLEAYSND